MTRTAAAPEPALCQARRLAASGDFQAAIPCYLEALRSAPDHAAAITELGAIALARGQRAAAATAFEQAVRLEPNHAVAHAGLGSILYDAGDLAAARRHYQAALAADPGLLAAHQGLARVLPALGERQAAERHWQAGFIGHSVMRMPYHGAGAGIPVLLLVSGKGGNLHVRDWIDNRVYAVTAVYADAHDPDRPLPAHDLIVNAIGDGDLCPAALAAAERLAAGSSAPLLNPPACVRRTSRPANARRFAGEPGIVAPRMAVVPRAEPMRAACLGFPLLLRSPGFHTGQFLVRVDHPDALAEAAAGLPGDDLLAVAYVDSRGPDGLFRKYRVMFIDGRPYPLHLAIAADWKVHYFSAAMTGQPAYRAEERRFLADMPGVLGERAVAALHRIRTVLDLDYAGVDFALAPDGSVILFEANATMVIAHPGPEPIWDYRRPAIANALDAARAMLPRRIGQTAAFGSPRCRTPDRRSAA